MKWIRDKDFIRGKTPMTKFNIRALNMAYLSIEEGDVFLDIGAGTGSISVEASLQGAKVYAIEKDKEAIELLYRNKKKFSVDMEVIGGTAPKDLPCLKVDKCFIGGSSGQLSRIFEYLEHYLKKDGILCGNFIKLRNLEEALRYLKEYNYKDIDVQLIQTSYMDEKGLLKGNNPIFIIKGVKG